MSTQKINDIAAEILQRIRMLTDNETEARILWLAVVRRIDETLAQEPPY